MCKVLFPLAPQTVWSLIAFNEHGVLFSGLATRNATH